MSKLLNTKHLIALFGVSHMTIRAFRAGSSARTPLPTATEKGMPENRVGFKPAEVKAWAKKHNVAMNCDPATLVGTEPNGKPKAVKPAVAKKAATATRKARPVAAKKAALKLVKPARAVKESPAVATA